MLWFSFINVIRSHNRTRRELDMGGLPHCAAINLSGYMPLVDPINLIHALSTIERCENQIKNLTVCETVFTFNRVDISLGGFFEFFSGPVFNVRLGFFTTCKRTVSTT